MKELIHKLHLMLSIPLGIIISILCITGAILVFESELKELCSPSLYKTSNKNGNRALHINELMPIVKKQVADSVELVSVQIPSDPSSNYRFGIDGKGHASLLVDPYTGLVKGEVNPYGKNTFFSFVRRLHRWFLFENKRDGSISIGKMVTGTATLVLVLILISGVVIWMPKSLKQLKTRLKINASKNRFRFWYDVHLAGGMYALLILLVISLTALTWSFDWYRSGFYAVLGIEQSAKMQTSEKQGSEKQSSHKQGSHNSIAKREKSATADNEASQSRKARGGDERSKKDNQQQEHHSETHYTIWDRVAWELQQTVPAYKAITIRQGKATVSINSTGNTRASDSYTFNPHTGAITDVAYYKDQPRSAKVRGWIYSLHVGSWGGIATRILYFVVCLIGAALPLSGYYIYFKKRSGKRKIKARQAES